MSKYSELVFMVNDLLKLISDDSTFTEEHIIYLLDTARSHLLKQKYENSSKNQISASNYQTIHIHLKEVNNMYGCCFGNSVQYVSTKPIPDLMNIGSIKVYGKNPFNYVIQYVPKERFEYVGYNKWTKNFIYCTIGDDNHLYVKVNDDACCYSILSGVLRFTGIFESPSQSIDYNCEDNTCIIEGNSCNILDNDFPMEDALLFSVIDLVTSKLVQAIYKPSDPQNNASDDLASIQTFIRTAMKDRFVKDYQS